jgi:serine/threonine-protein kinase RsbW
MEEPRLGDLKTIVSEACSNVVRHAYPDQIGTFEVEAFPTRGELTVVIRDFGRGLRTRADPEQSSLRLGLALISTLSNRCEISGGHGGTEIRMQLPLAS